MAPYKVMVDDNFHYMDESERYEHGMYSSASEAVTACKAIVDADLEQYFLTVATAEDAFERYKSFGSDPFIVSVGEEAVVAEFSAWQYAEERCKARLKSK